MAAERCAGRSGNAHHRWLQKRKDLISWSRGGVRYMPQFRLRVEHAETFDLIERVFDETRIIKREKELELGRWRFVVFGRQGTEGTVVREGCAMHLAVDDRLVYVATLGDPEILGVRGMPLEEFARGDIPDELRDLEIYHIDPVRPLKISEKRTLPSDPAVRDMIIEEFQQRNIAVIETPDEKYWSLSVLKYLYECDRFFPDVLTEALKHGGMPSRYC